MIRKVKIGRASQNGGMPRRARARHENRQMVFQRDRMQFREGANKKKKKGRRERKAPGINVIWRA